MADLSTKRYRRWLGRAAARLRRSSPRPRPLGEKRAGTRLSWKWLLLAAAVGAALIAVHLAWEGGRPHRWSETFLQAGSALLFFVVLLVFQRSLVERTVEETFRRLSRSELDETRADARENPLTPGDFHDDLDPLAVGSAFVRDAADRNFADAVLLGDPEWRLCRAQAWVYNNGAALELVGKPEMEWDAVAEHLAAGPHAESPLWEAFIASETEQFGALLDNYHDHRWAGRSGAV